jgi:hypothetical protein
MHPLPSSTSPAAAHPRWQRRWRLLGAAVAASAAVPLAAAPAAQAAAPRHNARVAQLLRHLQDRPMAGLRGTPMEYDREPYAAQLAQLLQGLRPEDVLPPGAAAPATPHMDRVVAALLYLAGGGLDQAHNLVTPLCGCWAGGRLSRVGHAGCYESAALI